MQEDFEANGQTRCPTELEKIMEEEAEELIKTRYRSRQGRKDIMNIKFKAQNMKLHKSQSLLDLTNLD